MKTIVLTGGGTAGHVTPHLALIPKLKETGFDIHYIGSAGIERQLMENQPLTFHTVQSGKLRRYFDWKNLTDPFRVIWGAIQSIRLIGKIKPDVCFSKGGFVAVPVVIGCWVRRVPVLAHESDLTPGLANRISARFAKKVAATFPECAKALAPKGVLTGTPLRPELFLGEREKGLQLAGFQGSKPVLLMMGGSQGAQAVNEALRGALPFLLPRMDVCHLCGKGKLAPALEGTPGYVQKEFVDRELPDVLAASDVVLSRAGETAMGEFLALRKPMLLVPYPKGASRGDQILNAEDFRKRGLAMVLPQEKMTPQTLARGLSDLLDQADSLRDAMAREPNADGAAAVYAMILELAGKKKHHV